ncbi:hypothetical protein vBCbaSRXM_39 [Citromicrobium phage vB_CbaS-RXM]|nr:hypothetical protein vBCbaSRXM_39 [Citromicrobium phage vB_CbaS-RXM]
MKFVAMMLMALIVIAALYFAVLGAVKLIRALMREDFSDEESKLKARERRIIDSTDDLEHTIRRAERRKQRGDFD